MITKEDNLREVVTKHPEAVPVFAEAGLHCIGCAIAQFETIEQGAAAHGMNVDELVKKLNEAIKE